MLWLESCIVRTSSARVCLIAFNPLSIIHATLLPNHTSRAQEAIVDIHLTTHCAPGDRAACVQGLRHELSKSKDTRSFISSLICKTDVGFWWDPWNSQNDPILSEEIHSNLGWRVAGYSEVYRCKFGIEEEKTEKAIYVWLCLLLLWNYVKYLEVAHFCNTSINDLIRVGRCCIGFNSHMWLLAKNGDATTPCWFFIIGCTCWANITPRRADTFPLHIHTFPMCNNIEEFKNFLKCPSWCALWLQYVASSVLWKKLGNLPGSSASALLNTIKLWTTSLLETPVHISPRTMIYSLGWMGTSVLSWFYQPVVMLGELIPATPTGDDPNIINSLTLN